MSELMIFGTICLVIGAIVFAISVNLSFQNSKGDDERFKEAIGNIYLGIIVASLLLCGLFAIDADTDSNRETDVECCCHHHGIQSDSTVVNNLK